MKPKMNIIVRYLLILHRLSGINRYMEADALLEYLNNQMSNRGFYDGISLRTMQRYFKEIDEIFSIKIKHRKGFGYYIADGTGNPDIDYEEIISNFDLLTSLSDDTQAIGYIIPEHHRPKGSDNLPLLLKAIKNNIEIIFDYTLIRHDNKITTRIIKPYFLKESLGLWYVVGMDENNNMRTFGVDRISKLQLRDKSFKRDKDIKPDMLFKDSFGIWDDPEIPVEDIELVYSPLDGKFLKNNPLHSSQTILRDDEAEFRITLRLRITNDFVMALLSRSASLEVIRPTHLRERIKNIYINALKRHENENRN